nr:sulfotransferase 16 [Tanacetum cinerariifolium]
MAPLNTQQNINPNTSLSVNSDNSINDPLSINNSDHPRMVLTQTPFNGGNFLGWSRNIKMTLGAKLKLGFIDRTCAKPAIIDVNYQSMDIILDWISDTGASDHMYPHLHLFTGVKILKHLIIVHLPDGRTKIVTLMGRLIRD